MRSVTPTPRALASFGIPRPAGWERMTEGERMDWLQDLIDAAAREYRRYDDATWPLVRAENLSRGKSV